MQFKHAPAAVSAMFDDPNLVSAAGLVPMLRLARSAGLDELAQSRLSVPTGNDSLIWPHRDGLIWPRVRHTGAVVTV